jgi:hypothetical protein
MRYCLTKRLGAMAAAPQEQLATTKTSKSRML